MEYKHVIGTDGVTFAKDVIYRISDDAFIPFDENNADYQQYLVDTDGGLPFPKETK